MQFNQPYCVVVFDIAAYQRVEIFRVEFKNGICAEKLFEALGKHYDVVQLWSLDENKNPVYRQW